MNVKDSQCLAQSNLSVNISYTHLNGYIYLFKYVVLFFTPGNIVSKPNAMG